MTENTLGRRPLSLVLGIALTASGGAALAQETTEAAAPDADALLTAAELQTLVAPVALYPDTLLIQILVGATAPLDVVKADRLLARSEGADAAALEEQVKAEGFDASVEVLSLAFPEVLGQMAEHIEWTETVGTAMLAQSDDVLDAVQVMRNTAINTGALVDTEQQVVTRDVVTETVVIQPADPQVVYVPQYNPQVVYDNSLTDALVVGAVTFGTIALIDEIFDDDDDWYGYWGCRNCGGWGGGPIIRDPDIDIDVDGDVNIGNRLDIEGGDRLNVDRNNLNVDRNNVNVDRDNVNVDRDNVNIDRDRTENNVGWRPDADKSDEARDKIAAKRGEGGATTLPLERPASDSDALRDRLSTQTGTRDITRDRDTAAIRDSVAADRAAGDRPAVNRPAGDRPAGDRQPVNRPEADRARVDRAELNRSGDNAARTEGREKLQERSGTRTSISRPQEVKRPNASRPAAASGNRRSPEIARNSSGSRAKAASQRGGNARAKANRR
jgi:hypothetical protein